MLVPRFDSFTRDYFPTINARKNQIALNYNTDQLDGRTYHIVP